MRPTTLPALLCCASALALWSPEARAETFTYDALGRLISAAKDSGTTGYCYDKADNRQSMTASGVARTCATGQPPPSGVTRTGNDQSDSTLTGGPGNDTLTAEHRADVMTGAGGADTFRFHVLPWSPGHVTDFTVGTDRLDLSPVFATAGYTGSDPIADGRVTVDSYGVDGTRVFFDDDGPGGNWPTLMTTLDHVPSAGLTWAQLSGG